MPSQPVQLYQGKINTCLNMMFVSFVNFLNVCKMMRKKWQNCHSSTCFTFQKKLPETSLSHSLIESAGLLGTDTLLGYGYHSCLICQIAPHPLLPLTLFCLVSVLYLVVTGLAFLLLFFCGVFLAIMHVYHLRL